LQGFDPKWRDVPDFINGITREIWEDRNIASLRQRYAPGLIVRSPASVVVDNSNVIAATMATLAEFPDRELPGEDVIWCEDPARTTPGSAAYLSSHRLISWATHSHAGVYGAPTGRRLCYRIVADCAIKDDRIDDEWLVRDQAAIVRQMGVKLVAWTRDLIAREGGPERCVKPMTPTGDVPGPYTGRGNDSPWGARLADAITAIMSAQMGVISTTWDRAANLHYPGGEPAFGHAAADQFWMGLRAAFPSATFTVDHVIGREDPMMPPRAAVRWSLWGKHDGWGRFGAPSGAQVYVMGITHVDFGSFGPSGTHAIRNEFTLIDDAAIWKQILLHTGAL
jgi:hypothetical protein